MKDIKKMTNREVDKYVLNVVYKELREKVLDEWSREHEDGFDYIEYGEEEIRKRLQEIYGDEYYIDVYNYENCLAGYDEMFEAFMDALGGLTDVRMRVGFNFEFGGECYIVTVSKD
ncbi:MAG: hypothetical protein IIZ94_04605 [Prevotella sp.]|nr:hypothetical protein [Prevotella sp.]